MKKSVSLLVVVCMIAACSVAFAMPKNVTYANTTRFLQLLDNNDLKYNYLGVDQDGDEQVRISFDDYIRINFFFSEDNEECNIRVWNVIELNPTYLESAYRICNELNASYKWCTFYVDSSDNTITISMDLILRDDDTAGDICFEALFHVVNICEKSYEKLKTLSV